MTTQTPQFSLRNLSHLAAQRPQFSLFLPRSLVSSFCSKPMIQTLQPASFVIYILKLGGNSGDSIVTAKNRLLEFLPEMRKLVIPVSYR
ncbi:hypothetical protein CEK25_002880 [Fusarium fujikuroi]|nr:hypothetical protein CEK25_002880 [Fusarium fujikuroi]